MTMFLLGLLTGVTGTVAALTVYAVRANGRGE